MFLKTYKSSRLLERFAKDFCESHPIGIYEFHFNFFGILFLEGKVWKEKKLSLLRNHFLIQVDKDESLYLSNDSKSLGYWVYKYFRNSATINDVILQLGNLVPSEENFLMNFSVRKGDFLVYNASIVFKEKIKLIWVFFKFRN